jgi:FkbM family methyltransferase
MSVVDSIIRQWQKAPLRWRIWFTGSPFAPPVRRFVNRLHPDRLGIFELQDPLRGHLFRLHWQTHKGFVFGTWEPEVTEALKRTVLPGWTVVDIGAHIGYHTLLLAKLAGSQGKVFAFEPTPETFQVLQENVSLNAYTNVVLVRKAVTDRPRSVTMMPLESDKELLPRSAAITDGVGEIEAISLDQFFAESPQKVALVKVDAEGEEAAVLDGMERVLKRDRPVLLIELHEWNIHGMDHPVFERLRKSDYQFEFLDREGGLAHILAKSAAGPL